MFHTDRNFPLKVAQQEPTDLFLSGNCVKATAATAPKLFRLFTLHINVTNSTTRLSCLCLLEKEFFARCEKQQDNKSSNYYQ